MLNDQLAAEGAQMTAKPQGQAKWYIVHTYSGYETTVHDKLLEQVKGRGLESQILEVKIPTETVIETEMKRLKQDGRFVRDENGDYVEVEVEKKVELKLFPCYVFIKMVMSDDNQNVVRSVRGCTGFVGLNSMNATEKVNGVMIHNDPPALSDEEVRQLGLESEEAPAPAEVRMKFKPGDTIRITSESCLFDDPVCVIESVDEKENSVTVVGYTFGRKTLAVVSASEVEAVE